jgi:hypothetical protein
MCVSDGSGIESVGVAGYRDQVGNVREARPLNTVRRQATKNNNRSWKLMN